MFIKLCQPIVLSLAIYKKSMFEKIFEPSVTKYFVQNPQLPILTIKIKLIKIMKDTISHVHTMGKDWTR